MQKEVLEFYSHLRQIFTVCPCCEKIHRLSDCKLYQRKKPPVDWKESIDKEIAKLETLEERLQQKIQAARIIAREAGRKSADRFVRKIDPVFAPLKLNPNDAKVLFHPVDFIVFDGMNNNSGKKEIKQVLLLDKDKKSRQNLDIQKSIEKAISSKYYEWLTLRVRNDGKIQEEE